MVEDHGRAQTLSASQRLLMVPYSYECMILEDDAHSFHTDGCPSSEHEKKKRKFLRFSELGATELAYSLS